MATKRKEIGKIESVHYGIGGYQDAMIGTSFTLAGKGWGVGDFWGGWAKRSESARYSQQDWLAGHAESVLRLRDLLSAAGCQRVDQLRGKPVEVVFEGNALASWRILTEVL